jgi:hypothetical protein
MVIKKKIPNIVYDVFIVKKTNQSDKILILISRN